MSANTATKKACPICGALSTKDYIPFCSKRCADVDLGRWLKDGYTIPTNEEDAGSTVEPTETEH